MARPRSFDDWLREAERRRRDEDAPRARIRKLKAKAAIDAYHRRTQTPRRRRPPAS